MATPAIGLIQFATMRGRVSPVAQTVEDVTRPGVDGHELKQIGKRGRICELVTIADFDLAATAATHIATCLAAQGGDLVTVAYRDGTTTENVAIQAVMPGPIHRALASAGGLTAGLWHVETRWSVFQATEVEAEE